MRKAPCTAETCESIRLRKVSVLRDVRLKRFYCRRMHPSEKNMLMKIDRAQ